MVGASRYCSMRTPSGPSKMMPALDPVWFEDPSIERYQSPLSIVGGPSGVNSMMKSANACAFTWPLRSNEMSNSDNWTLHATILPAKSGFLNSCRIGKSVRTIMLKFWKYGRSCHEAITRAKAAFSIFWYLLSAP
ncbi:hypothetical protein CR513_21646, partial [Mucuna pruriens]